MSEALQKPKRRWPRWFFAIFGLLLTYGIWEQYGPYPTDDPAKDTCSFGEVPNSRYQEFLKIAQGKIKSGEWPPLSGNRWGSTPRTTPSTFDIEAEFKRRFDDVLQTANSNNEQIAAIHAAARAMGGRYEPRVGAWIDKPLNEPRPLGSGRVYRFDMRKFGDLSPLFRWIGVSPTFSLDNGYLKLIKTDFGFNTVGIDWPWQYFGPPPSGLCPPSFNIK